MKLRFNAAVNTWLGLAAFCFAIAIFAFATGTLPEETRRWSWLSPGIFADVFGDYSVVANWVIYGTMAIGGAVWQMTRPE